MNNENDNNDDDNNDENVNDNEKEDETQAHATCAIDLYDVVAVMFATLLWSRC